jgi:tetratricopeptide (TPR) repeat protein
MVASRVFPLESIRTDGWFERIGEGVGSFQTLCEVIGPRFFAFSMIAGARIVALTIDRRNPEQTLVDFVVVTDDATAAEAPAQRLSLRDFRRRLVSALATEESPGPAPTRPTDVETIQRHIGVRYLLLAPLFGYSLSSLTLDVFGSMLRALRDGIEELYELEEFRARIRLHVRDELQRAERPGTGRGAIDLSRVQDAEEAAARGDDVRVLELLGTWPAPLAIFLRTPEGQMLSAEARARIATALALLGSACISMGETEKGEEILRLGIQYAGDTSVAAEVYHRLGRSMLRAGRYGEAIGPLKRAANLGVSGEDVWFELASAFMERNLWLAAFGAALEARDGGAADHDLGVLMRRITLRLGAPLEAWRKLTGL